ncbi:MAG: hypothetical protein OEY79_01290 [Anaplasmataceae bacterium]|nr:hypothetical protein [Anaplasmataceae bacterium]
MKNKRTYLRDYNDLQYSGGNEHYNDGENCFHDPQYTNALDNLLKTFVLNRGNDIAIDYDGNLIVMHQRTVYSNLEWNDNGRRFEKKSPTTSNRNSHNAYDESEDDLISSDSEYV